MLKASHRSVRCLGITSAEYTPDVFLKSRRYSPVSNQCHSLHQLSFSSKLQTRRAIPESSQRRFDDLFIRAAGGDSISKGDYRSRSPSDINVLVVGSTGYIGKFVVSELIRRGYHVIALARERSGIGGATTSDVTRDEFAGADVRFGEVTNIDSLREVAFKTPVDVVISCLASRTGGKSDSWLIDYEATLNTLHVAQEKGASHFVLLSAICVQKPKLEFQRAKLKFEAALKSAGEITYTIIRPTSYFKSLAGQVEVVKKGGPFVMFGDGRLTACKPISEADLASFMVDAVTEKDMVNKTLPIGGPGEATTPIEQAAMIFKYAKRKENVISVPLGLMDGLIGFFEFLEKIFPKLEDTVEFARIGRYYATESMLVWDDNRQEYDAEMTPSYGNDTLEAFFKKSVEEGLKGQELGDQAVFWTGK